MALTVAQVMQPLSAINGQPRELRGDDSDIQDFYKDALRRLVGPVTLSRRPQVLFADKDLEQARRQLVLYGRDGLPVLSHGGQLKGWVTRADILKALTTKLETTELEIRDGPAATEAPAGSSPPTGTAPTRPLPGYELLELRVNPDSPALGRKLGEIPWPSGRAVVALTRGREVHAAAPGAATAPR